MDEQLYHILLEIIREHHNGEARYLRWSIEALEKYLKDNVPAP